MAMSGKYKITVDTTVLANGDSIAAYLTSAAGTLLTATTVGGKEALDVHSTATKAEDSAHVSGDMGNFVLGVRNDAGTVFGADGDYVPLSIDANGALRVAATVNFAGDYAEDSAHVSGDVGLFSLAVRRDARSAGSDIDGDYSSINVNAVGELWTKDADVLARLVLINSDTTAILADTATIDSQTLSIQNLITALSKAEDAVASSGDQGIQALAVRKDASGSNAANGDYTSLLTWSEGSLKVVDNSNAALLQQLVSVATIATALPTTALANRRSILVQNAGSASIWVGAATVTSSGATQGIEVPKGGHIELDAGPDVTVYAIASGSAVNAAILQMA